MLPTQRTPHGTYCKNVILLHLKKKSKQEICFISHLFHLIEISIATKNRIYCAIPMPGASTIIRPSWSWKIKVGRRLSRTNIFVKITQPQLTEKVRNGSCTFIN
jgi:diphthamide synthase subunit DPH2